MSKTFYDTVAYLSYCGHNYPTLEFKGEYPMDYTNILIKDSFGQVVIPSGFYKDGTPYFSDKLYQKLEELRKIIAPVDHEQAQNVFFFNVTFEI